MMASLISSILDANSKVTGAVTLYVDGDSGQTRGLCGNSLSLTDPPRADFRLSARLNKGIYLTGDIGEVQLYASALSASRNGRRRKLRLRAKFGIALRPSRSRRPSTDSCLGAAKHPVIPPAGLRSRPFTGQRSLERDAAASFFVPDSRDRRRTR